MTTNKFVSLEKQLLPDLSGFAIKGRLMFMPPVESVLRGIHFEGSAFDKTSFSVTVFVMPLCVPTEYLYFNFGKRLRHGAKGALWQIGEPDMLVELTSAVKLQAVPFLSRVESLLDFVEVARSFSSGNPHTPRAIAFALARAGQSGPAAVVLDKLLNRLDMSVAWQRQIAEQATNLKAKLVASPAEARQQLESWEAETVRNLGLDDVR
jgi:hypothetical protein